MPNRNTRTIDLSVLRRNFLAIRAAVPATAGVCAVVKADAYGHGAVQTARTLSEAGADMLAVADAGEGAELRLAGIRTPILVLGAVCEDNVRTGVTHDLIQTVCSPEMVYLCARAAAETGRKARVHLKIDTGMGRIGVRDEAERDDVLRALAANPSVVLEGAFTHFADADGDDDGMAYTDGQYERFLRLTAPLEGRVIRHCANSAAIHRRPEFALDMVRAGISLYGYPPVKTETELEPAMTWTATVSYVKTVQPGESVSYGRTYVTGRETRIATVTCGYGDGYHRAASGSAEVLIRGKKARVIGRICMDQMMADVTDIPGVRAGDEVILIGRSGDERVTAEDIAANAGTIGYEILLGATNRVSRVWKP
ncbi:MAG: alanine racemase [Clostridia bacterium]|nr:alanine racemase [Clostridia bacterium]